MSSDRELLELAAKAAGIKGWWADGRDFPYVQDPQDERAEYPWNPLVHDGDAFRLAVKLRLSVYHAPSGKVLVLNADGQLAVSIEDWEHSDAATRSRAAIVRAAAQIGAKA